MFNSFFYGLALLYCAVLFPPEIAQDASYPPDDAVRDAVCRVDYFFTPGCDKCRSIEGDLLPRLEDIFGKRIRLVKHNLFNQEEYARMMQLRRRLPFPANGGVFFVIDRQIYVEGEKARASDMIAIVEEQLAASSKRKDFARNEPLPPGQMEASESFIAGTASGEGRWPAFTLLSLALAGLLDGVNPCAFAALVFLITLVLAGGGRGRRVILIGAGFCCGVFATYYLIGLGLFQVFRMSFSRELMADVLRRLFVAALLIMAFLSFRDAWLFHVSVNQADIALKLPDRIARLVRRFIRSSLPRHFLFAGSLVLGAGVTVLESACTGQLYIPAIAFMAGTSPLKLRALLLLALYNVMFIIPLMALFLAAYYGVQGLRFVAMSRKMYLGVKCAMGCIFTFFAAIFFLS